MPDDSGGRATRRRQIGPTGRHTGLLGLVRTGTPCDFGLRRYPYPVPL